MLSFVWNIKDQRREYFFVLDDINVTSHTLTSESSSAPKNCFKTLISLIRYQICLNKTTFCKWTEQHKERYIKQTLEECHESEFLPTHFSLVFGYENFWARKEHETTVEKWRNMHSLNVIQNTSSLNSVTALDYQHISTKSYLTHHCDDIILGFSFQKHLKDIEFESLIRDGNYSYLKTSCLCIRSFSLYIHHDSLGSFLSSIKPINHNFN